MDQVDQVDPVAKGAVGCHDSVTCDEKNKVNLLSLGRI